ncbi:hypothetical protein PAXRUDRAFT_641664 [Paxillus rubicundulus Ve08.2h10]|uniref:Uncharacterized protein n=1 Tax=Paxillus rubicundulus Ve08.2h10 TaxID=930991 RepID=A0A0D0DVF8_9AGAM|nr:hypothetical protein PAXRUDRAFT_641664 [Paxillus rubicundulus Ve08.2h10]
MPSRWACFNSLVIDCILRGPARRRVRTSQVCLDNNQCEKTRAELQDSQWIDVISLTTCSHDCLCLTLILTLQAHLVTSQRRYGEHKKLVQVAATSSH